MIKNICSLLILLLFAISCSVKQPEDVDDKLKQFTEKINPELRENVWSIKAVNRNGNLIFQGETDHPEWKVELLAQPGFENVIDEIAILPDSSVGAKTYGLINLSVANLRTKPNHSAEMATQARFGTPVKILKKKDNWYLVQTPDNYISWVDDDGIVPVSQLQLFNWKNSDRLIFTGDNQIACTSESMSRPITDITLGSILEKMGESRNNFKVKLPDGRIGFVDKNYWVNFDQFKNETYPDTSAIRSMALHLMGRPYLWGGTSNRAMDCSGLVKVIYFMNGIILARDASLQIKYGELIEPTQDLDSFQTGDLLFFGRKENENQPKQVTHVALSLGGTEYIHASGRIKRNSLNPQSEIFSEYRKNSFVRARRIIGNKKEPGIVAIKNHPWY